MDSKYYDRIEAAQLETKSWQPLPVFDFERLRPASDLKTRATNWLKGLFLEDARWWLPLARRWSPVVRLLGLTIITRVDDVEAVLRDQDKFETPFGREMAEMAGGKNFILGMADGRDYRELKGVILTAFPRDEMGQRVRPVAARHSAAIMRHAGPGFDAIRDLLKIVPVRICRDVFGMIVHDEVEFADWALALSSIFFADPYGDRTTRELALVAAENMRAAIDRSFDAALVGRAPPDSPLDVLARLHRQNPDMPSRADVSSIMMGMIAGFAPTNMLAAGNCLDFVLSRREAQDAIEAAIAAGDDAALDAAILEAMRFKPINIGPFRYANRDTTVAGKKIKKGECVVPSTLSAMFDPARVEDPKTYRPGRPDGVYKVFGHGLHWCIGAEIAMAQVAESFRALFAKPNLRRAKGPKGRLTRLGAFPEHLHVDFDLAPESRLTEHAYVTIVAPVQAARNVIALRAQAAGLANPAGGAVKDDLDQLGIVHFASLSIAGAADPALENDKTDYQVVLEFSADGPETEVIAAFARAMEVHFRPIFAAACDLPEKASFEKFLRDHAVAVSPSIRKTAGLCFSGVPGHSVRRIRAEQALEREIGDILEGLPPITAPHASERLAQVRAELAARGGWDWAFEAAPSRLDGPEGKTGDAVGAALGNPALIAGVALGVLLLAALFFGFVLGGPAGPWWRDLLAFLFSIPIGALGLLAVVGIMAGAVYGRFRMLEKRDAQHSAIIPDEWFEPIADRENLIGHNHLAAISTMKPGPLRRLALRLAFFAIRLFAVHVFRPGHLSDIGSIHFARWVLLPGTNKLMFFSNYGGSWESYLEDFITKASEGLTGVWSNTVGYPRTTNLFFDGARDAERFKRWARAQQIPTLFWYSAYPNLTTSRIRVNSAVRQGLSGAGCDVDAAAWLQRFGAAPRPAAALESDDIQSLFFGGMSGVPEAEMVAVRIADDLPPDARRRFMAYLEANTSFGDHNPKDEALIVAFGPQALRRLGLDGTGKADPRLHFPLPFRRGMVSANQSRVLADEGVNDPNDWQWGSSGNPVDAVILCYAKDDTTLKTKLAGLRAELEAAGVDEAAHLRLGVEKRGGKAIEHFGFRDNISQPVVEGMLRWRSWVAPQHRLAPGELLLGYPDEHSNIPPPIAIPASRDPKGHLAAVAGYDLGERGSWRDFGRNGSFLVVRQIEQFVEKFNDYCAGASKAVSAAGYGFSTTPEWVGAKMLGRWKDGSSLVRNEHHADKQPADNSFTFNNEDPQGLKCPLGAHVRRANPRDSLGPDIERQIGLSKRHRILRVGRTYAKPAGKGNKVEKGMLFMCLNADIERQFEFVQQTWLMNRSFKSLRDERDPFCGPHGGAGAFTVPTADGPVLLKDLPDFIRIRGGGYFFMPGRRAMRYLLSRLEG